MWTPIGRPLNINMNKFNFTNKELDSIPQVAMAMCDPRGF